MSADLRRALPSVNALLESAAVRRLLERAPRALVVRAVREALDEVRRGGAPPADEGEWERRIAWRLELDGRPSLRPVLNATGVVLHTNLGRAPLPAAALDAMRDVAEGYANLEYDLDAGARGSRHVHAVALLRELTGAEDAIVVNNCAAGLVLALDTFAHARDAIVSRGELVEIGGSFRIPDIMAKSGARLVEVGTTNRTHLDDYRRALSPATGALVKVHRSNFAIEGFVAEVAARELAPLAREGGVALVEDLGSGLLLDLAPWGLRGERTAREAVADGADVVLMSGDKLLGGPQAGIVLGRADAIAAMRRNPLCRALRVDKLTFAALEATLALYRDPELARREIPTLRMLTADPATLEQRASALAERLRAAGIACAVTASEGSVGGGAFPTARLASFAVALEGDAGAHDARLRAGRLPVVGRVLDGRLLLDLRSVPESHDAPLVDAVTRALAGAAA